MPTFRSYQRRCCIKKAVLKNSCFGVFLLISCQPFKKETPTQVSSYKYSKIFKNTYFQEMYERLFLYFKILKKNFFGKRKSGKLKTRKGQKSWKSWKNYSEFSYFQVSDFALQPKSKTRI